MTVKVGARVGAIRSADEETVYFYGWGTYVGDFPLPGSDPDVIPEDERGVYLDVARNGHYQRDADYLTEMIQTELANGERTGASAAEAIAAIEARLSEQMAQTDEERALEMYRSGLMNPKIVLDDDAGDVFGFECWWGSAKAIEQVIGDRTVVAVPVPAREASSDD